MKNVLLLLTVFMGCVSLVQAQTVQINEFMSSNDAVLMDAEEEYCDWMEIYNYGNESVYLHDYYLSDKASNTRKWRFPGGVLDPGEYVVVFASGKDQVFGDEMHTNFKISSSGENLFLSTFNEVIDQVPEVELKTNQSYGRINDEIEWKKMQTPTPGCSNMSVNQIFISHTGGFYNDSFQLSISSSNGDTVYYTTNGNTPTTSSFVYDGAIDVYNRTEEENVFSEIVTTPNDSVIAGHGWISPGYNVEKCFVLRYASFKNGERTSAVGSHSFIFMNDDRGEFSMPVISIVTDSASLFDYDTGIYVPGAYYDLSNPNWSGNYFRKGIAWERDAHIEMFTHHGIEVLEQDAGLRIHGGKTRQVAQKSLRLYARREYGNKYFKYPLMPQRDNDNYKRFILHTTMSNWGRDAVIKDLVAQSIVSELDLDYQTFQPAIVFLNGEYWGIHNIMDRIDEYFVEYTHDIDNDDVMVEDWHSPEYCDFLEYLENNSLAIHANYNYVLSKIDLEEYMNYMIAEMYMANYDWPCNNNEFWREVPFGKWRWIIFDLDATMSSYDFNMIRHATLNDSTVHYPNPPISTILFRRLLENDEFRESFIDKYLDVIENVFTTEMMNHKVDSIRSLFCDEMPFHIARWHFPSSYDEWVSAIDETMIPFLEERSIGVRENLNTFFSLGLELDGDVSENYLGIGPNPSKGIFSIFNLSPNDLEDIELIVFAQNGNMLFRKEQVDLSRGGSQRIVLPASYSGVCILKIVDGSIVSHYKVVVSQ